MSHQLGASALILIALAGLMQGSFVVPMKAMRKWEWENTWLVFCFLGFIVLPSALAVATVPHLGTLLAKISFRSLAPVVLFGLGWGCGSACFGLGVERLGVGLALSIILGITSVLGSLVPWLTSPSKPLAYSIFLWVGIIAMLSGVLICSAAGSEREKSQTVAAGAGDGSGRFRSGLGIAISSGVLSCFLNFGFTYGNNIAQRAQALGASVTNAPNVLWLIIMMAGFLANASYCCHRLFTKGTWEKYGTETARYFGWAFVMAALWVASLVAYGQGANKIGALGPSVGWAILMSMSIVASNAWGVATGEWHGASRKAMRMMTSGVGILLVAVVIFAWAATKT